MRWARQVFGEDPAALRCWSVVVGAATILLAARVARRLPDASARPAALALIVLSSFAFTIFTEARMYGLLALAVLGLLETVLSVLEGRSTRWWASVWIAVGLHSHYYFVHYGFVLLLTLAVLALRRADVRRGVRRLLAPTLLGFASFLPWALTGLRAQLTHDLPSGGSSQLYLDLRGFCESLAHLLFMNASLGGRATTLGVALPGSVAGAAVGALGLGRLWRARREDGGRFLTFLLAAALAAPAWSFFVAWAYPRAGYNWRYISGSCVPLLFVVAAGIAWRPWPRAAASAVLFVTLAIVTLVNAVSPGQEDFRGAVARILSNARPGDAVVLRPLWEADPARSPTSWDYYRTRVERPPGGAEPVEYRPPRHAGALTHERVWVLLRPRFPAEVLADLREEFPNEEKTPVGNMLEVYLFTR